MTKGLFVKEILENTYSKLAEKIIEFPTVCVEVASFGSDFHGYQKGYMLYDNAGIIDNKWAIAVGKSGYGWLTEGINCDLLALEFDDNLDNLMQELRASTYFYNSLLGGLSDGRLELPDNSRFRDQMSELRPETSFMVQQPEYYGEAISATFEPIPIKPVLYRAEIVDYLVDTIRRVLNENP